MSPSDRERQIEALLARYRKLLEERLPTGPQTLDEIEQTVEEIGQEMDRELQRRILQQRKTPRDNQAHCPDCGRAARYRATHSRTIVTLHGEVTFARPYYYCQLCRHGFAPLDRQLGLDAGTTSRGVRVRAARLAALLPFAQAARELAFLCHVHLCPKTVQHLAQQVGSNLLGAHRRAVEAHHQGRLPEPKRARPSVFYVAADGTQTPMRGEWREVKVGVTYETQAHRRQESGSGVEQATYLATLETSAAFGARLATMAHEQGYHLARQKVFLGDGAPWLWNVAAAQFPEAVQILDFYHASEHLMECATAIYGEGAPEAKQWLRRRQEELLSDRLWVVLAELRGWEAATTVAQELKQRQLAYFQANAERMRYGTYRRCGYHIGSGMVEGACKTVVGTRFKQAGMRWTEPVVEPMLALRTAVLSHTTPDLATYCTVAS